MARTCGQCGALSGAIMGIGLLTGRDDQADSKELTYEMVQECLRDFQLKFGSTNCRELLDCDLSTPEGMAAFETNDLIQKCYEFTEEATRIAVTLLENQIKSNR
jgi:C_GCAxxG_C_C family probable redox protein